MAGRAGDGEPPARVFISLARHKGSRQLSAAPFGRGLRRQLHVLSTSAAPAPGLPAAHPSDLVASIGWDDQTT